MYKYLSHRQLIGTFDRYNNQIVLRLYPRELGVIRMIDEISGSRGATILTVLFLTLYRSGTYDFAHDDVEKLILTASWRQ